MTPDPLDLDAVEALCDAATPGPWTATLGVSEFFGTEMSVYSEHTELMVFSHIGCSATSADMEFAAAARTLVPALVTRLRAAEAENVRLRAVETWLRGGEDGPSCFDRWICTPNGQEGPVVARHYEAPADLEAPTWT